MAPRYHAIINDKLENASRCSTFTNRVKKQVALRPFTELSWRMGFVFNGREFRAYHVFFSIFVEYSAAPSIIKYLAPNLKIVRSDVVHTIFSPNNQFLASKSMTRYKLGAEKYYHACLSVIVFHTEQ